MSAECVNSADKSSASETSVSPAVLPERGGRPSPFAIGIDFGTSKCCVAVVRDGRVDVLENELGQRTTPSCVAFNSQQRLVGSDALSQAVVNCDNTVHGVKKFLGRTYDEVKDLSSLCRINPTEPSDIFENFIHYKNTDLRLRPEQVAAMLLGKMKDIAESSLGCPVDRAVISVPASFGNAQRLAIKNAAQVAGLEVLELINETTAAGVAFVENRTVQTPEVIAVVDFGAGKLDVSIMEVRGRSVKIIAAAGNPNFGGYNIDDSLVSHCVAVIMEKHNYTVTTKKHLMRLRGKCEKAKKILSLHGKARVIIERLFKDTKKDLTIKRIKFNELIQSRIRNTLTRTFDHLLDQILLTKDAISKVVLVGGSTRVPLVRAVLEGYFGPGKLDQTLNKDEAVARGAALRAAMVSGQETSIKVRDVASYAIFANVDGYNDRTEITIRNRYPNIPLNHRKKFTLKKYNCLKNLYESFFTEGTKTEVQVSYTQPSNIQMSSSFGKVCLVTNIDSSGILEVHTEALGIILYSWEIEEKFFCPFSTINEWTEAENKFRKDVDRINTLLAAEVQLESLVYEVENSLSGVKELTSEEISKIKNQCDDILKWIDDDEDSASLQDLHGKIKKLTHFKETIDRMKSITRAYESELKTLQQKLFSESKE